jgi:hypothetical protein
MFTPDNMLAFGSCITGFGILVTGLLALLFRHPNAPRWTRPEIVAMLVCVPLTAVTGLGLGYTAYGLFLMIRARAIRASFWRSWPCWPSWCWRGACWASDDG